jgi:hypothetical protein
MVTIQVDESSIRHCERSEAISYEIYVIYRERLLRRRLLAMTSHKITR